MAEATEAVRSPRRADELAGRVLAWSLSTSNEGAVAFVVLGLAACWAGAYAAGGAGAVAPHWFYLPVLFAAARFGCRGALLAGVAAGLAAGPLLPLEVDAGIPQTPEDWLARAGFLLLIGQLVALVVSQSRRSIMADVARQREAAELQSGLAREEFVLHYQPVVSLETGELSGLEALVRWQHPVLGLLLPARFIADAERTGLIARLGAHVLAQALADLADWDRHVPASAALPLVGVNVSAVELADPDYVDRVATALQTAGTNPDRLVLEITETALLNDLDVAAHALHALRRLGVRIAIDDFGTGRASLAYLHRLPHDLVKIDRTFTAALTTPDARANGVSHAVLELTDKLHVDTVAEGVETAGQVHELRRLGCRLGQGYHLCPPQPADEILTILRSPAPFADRVGSAVTGNPETAANAHNGR